VTGALSVLVTYPGIEARLASELIAAAAPSAEVRFCEYENGHEVRVRRERHPFDASTRAAVPPLSDEQRVAFAQADVGLCLDVPLDLGTVAPRLRWVHCIGSGVGQYVSSELPAAGIVLTNSAGVSGSGIAEFVLARLLEQWKLFPTIDQMQRERRWAFAFGRRLEGSTLGIVGLGAIGGALAALARVLGMRVLATRRSAKAGDVDDRVDELYPASELDVMLGLSDAVVLCATGSSDNESLFDTGRFAAMKPGAFFVNVARGSLVDEVALIAALRSGHLAAAATDVTRVEPIPIDSPLWDVPNLRLSPHSASTQDGYARRVVELFCDNLVRFLHGRPLRNVVDLATGY
jgi:phosphoglycerate dehydrogenase-like enzyme